MKDGTWSDFNGRPLLWMGDLQSQVFTKMEQANQLVFTTRDPLLSSSNVAMTVTCNLTKSLSQTASSNLFSTPLNSPLLMSPSAPLWSPVSLQSPSLAVPPDSVPGSTIYSDEDYQTPEVLGEIVIGDEEESEEEDISHFVNSSEERSGRKTPRNINRILEQHRTSERNRHHDLNATINHICWGIPGHSPYVRETKIIKMQRIINYICHLESHVQSLCDEMGITFDFKNIFLSAKTNACTETSTITSAKTECTRSQMYEPEAPIPDSISRKMKIRSPTIDFANKDEDEELEWLKNCSGLDSPDASILTPDDCDQILSSLDVGAQVTVEEQAEDSHRENHPSSLSLPSTPFTGLHNSHQAYQRVPQFDPPCGYSPWHDETPKSHPNTSEACVPCTPLVTPDRTPVSPVTPLRRSQRRRILRSPLLRLASLFKDSSSECEEEVDDHDDDFKCTAVPYHWSRTDNGQHEERWGMRGKASSRRSKAGSKSQVDLRKTSWMNGFMMYSRIHRRLYIRENPGIHTAHISKLMGQDWRAMTPEQQTPYKEKAVQYTRQFLLPSADRLAAKSRRTIKEVKPEALDQRETAVSHLVPCFHKTAGEASSINAFRPTGIERSSADAVVPIKEEVFSDSDDKENFQRTNQLATEFDFTRLFSTPSKRTLHSPGPLDTPLGFLPLKKFTLLHTLPGDNTGVLDDNTGVLDDNTGVLDDNTGVLDDKTGVLDDKTGVLDETETRRVPSSFTDQ